MKVLIVEDNPIIQRLYGRAIEHEGHTVIAVPDGSLALAAATVEQPDIVLMDIMMPTMNGIDALIQLKSDKSTKHIPVAMLSAYDDPALMQKALQSGANRFLVKSNVEPQDIVPYIQQTIASSHQ